MPIGGSEFSVDVVTHQRNTKFMDLDFNLKKISSFWHLDGYKVLEETTDVCLFLFFFFLIILCFSFFLFLFVFTFVCLFFSFNFVCLFSWREASTKPSGLVSSLRSRRKRGGRERGKTNPSFLFPSPFPLPFPQLCLPPETPFK